MSRERASHHGGHTEEKSADHAIVPGRATQVEDELDVDDDLEWEELEAVAEPDAGDLGAGATKGGLPHGAQMEQLFGESLGDVSAQVGADLGDLGARGAARGNTVAFAETDPSPGLVAHEVAHVMQQRRGGTPGGRSIAPEDSHAEREADAIGDRVERGDLSRAEIHAAPAGAVHLKRGGHYARRDQYNRPQMAGRPQVTVGKHKLFELREAATRYTISHGDRGLEFDTLPDKTKVTVNISKPRSLVLADGKHHHCVLSRTVKGGSAWIRIDQLHGDPAALEAAARHAAAKYAPAATKGRLNEHVFVDVPAHTQDSNLALTPEHSRQTRAKFEHYLERKTDQVETGFFNICLNLPQHGTPPVQVDVARPGDHFFVMMTRQVAAYEIGGNARNHPQTWVFGSVGKQDATGAWAPDPSRRGWVPAKALRKT